MQQDLSRRDLLKSAAVGTALAVTPGVFAKQEGTINCGFIGTGGRGRGDLGGLLQCEDVKVIAICDINPDNLEKGVKMVKDKQGHEPERYGKGPEDYKRMLERKDLHAVGMATPCDLHAPMFKAAIEAGKHIYGEKPMGLTNQEMDEVCAAADKRKDLVVQLGFQWMSNKRFLDGVKRLQAGEIGKFVEGRWARHNGASPLRGWFSERKHSGDWMIEQACHEINVLNWITDAAPLQAFALGRRDLWTKDEPNRDVTDYYAAVIEYPNNFIVHFAHDWNSPGRFATGMEMTVIGDAGAMDIWKGDLAFRDREKKAEPLAKHEGDDTVSHWQTFINCIRTGTPTIANARFGKLASQVGLLIRKAIDTKKAVTWDEMLKTC